MKKKLSNKEKRLQKRNLIATDKPWWKIEKKNWGYLIAILLITLIAFSPSLNCGFTNWDDNLYILENPLVTGQLSNTFEEITTAFVAGNYHPLTLLSLSFDYQIAGLDPFQYHLTNLILHLINTILVFFFIFLLSKRKIWVALITTFVFAIHPLHVESVTWISERKDVLYTLFFLGSLISYIRYRETKKWKILGISFLFFFLSVISKPAAVVLPVLLLAIDFYRKEAFTYKLFWEKAPFFIISLIFGLIAVKAQVSSSAMGDFEFFTIWERICFASYGLIWYLIKFFIPFGLSNFHPYPVEGIPAWFNALPILIAAIAGLTLFSLKKSRLLSFVVLFYVINLALVLQFVSVGNALTAERYTYVPYIGIGFLLGYFFEYLRKENSPKYRKYKVPYTGFLILLACFFIVLTYNQTKVWTNSETLWTNAISVYPKDSGSYCNRGHYFSAIGKLDIALADYNKAISLDPKNARAYLNRGKDFFDLSQYDEALADYNKSINLKPDVSETYSNRAAIYTNTGRLELALSDLNKAVELDPNNSAAWSNRGITNQDLKNFKESNSDFSRCLELKPNQHKIHNSRGINFRHLGQNQKAVDEFTISINLYPSNGIYYQNRAYAYASLGNKPAALQDARKAMSLGVQIPQSILDKMQ